jgi:histidinol phosphatase-like enzyme (inositol monophosphatase family)
LTSALSPDLIIFAERLADAARGAIRPYFRQSFAVETKPNRTPVTIADRAAEEAMRRLITETFPAHGIVGEELGAEREDAEFVWILDPIDGTKSFATGLPIFGTLIALVHDGRPVIGIIDQPILTERWLGVRGRPSLFNGKPAKTRPCSDLANAALFATTFDRFNRSEMARFQKLVEMTSINRLSGDCYAYGLLALGLADVVVDAEMKPHDFAALVPVIEGAGGAIGDWEERPLPMRRPSRVAAVGDPKLFGAVCAVLSGKKI